MLKSAVKKAFPRLVPTIQAVRQVHARSPFDGVFTAFPPPDGNYYAASEWIDASIRAVRAIRAQRAPVDLAHHKDLLITTAAALGSCSILDFGGAVGLDYAAIRAADPASQARYHVVDFEEVCTAGRKEWEGDERITFSADLPQGEFDMVYSCTSLHAVADPVALFERLLAYKAKAILLVRHPFHDRAFVRAQVNVTPHRHQWVLSLPQFEEMAKTAGYRLRMCTYSGDVYRVDHFPAGYRVGRTANLLFVRG